MKRLVSALIALSFIVSLPAVSLAQQPRPAPVKPSTKTERAAWANKIGVHDTRDIIGTRVKNAEGKDMGEVDALLVDPKDGKVTHVVIGLGGFLGIGEDKVVVPWSEIKMAAHQEGKTAIITMDRGALERAPKYVKAGEREPSASPATK